MKLIGRGVFLTGSVWPINAKWIYDFYSKEDLIVRRFLNFTLVKTRGLAEIALRKAAKGLGGYRKRGKTEPISLSYSSLD